MNLADAPKPETHQFKNAFHMCKNSPRMPLSTQLEFSPQKIMKKNTQISSHLSHFGMSPLSKHFKDIDLSPNKSKSSLDGFGITVDDSGHLLIAEWRNNQIEGRYFLFKPNLIEETEKNSNYSAICQYGWMKGGNLSGENYIYNISGTLAKAFFQNNKITGKCFIIHSNKLFVANEANQLEKIECEIINNQVIQEIKQENSSILKVPKITISQTKESKGGTPSNAKFPSNYQQIQTSTFIKPNQFLEDLVTSYQQQGEKKNEQLAYMRISERQTFLGFIQNDKKQQKQSSFEKKSTDILSKVTGFGVILKNEWPTSYGTYKEGKISGLGRIYESEMSLFDGYFLDGQLMEGFIIDHFANTTSFGHQSSIDPQYKSELHQEDCFIITNTFQTLSCEYLVQYKKNFHLKSLNFNNSYFNSPKLIHRSPWPYNIINKLTKRTQIQTIIKSFRPSLRDMQISSIQKIGHSSDNRVEKLLVQEIKQSNNPSVREQEVVERQELLKQKSLFIKSEIEKNLKEKEQRTEQNKQKEITTYINEYKRLERRKTEIIQTYTPKPKSKKEENISQSQIHSQSTDQNQLIIKPIPIPTTPNKRLALTPKRTVQPQPDPQAQQDLSQLVHEYHQCQTQRKNSISGNTTKRTNTDGKLTPRGLLSKRELIQQDHLHFLGKEKPNLSGRPYQARRKVDLDLIYRQYLYK